MVCCFVSLLCIRAHLAFVLGIPSSSTLLFSPTAWVSLVPSCLLSLLLLVAEWRTGREELRGASSGDGKVPTTTKNPQLFSLLPHTGVFLLGTDGLFHRHFFLILSTTTYTTFTTFFHGLTISVHIHFFFLLSTNPMGSLPVLILRSRTRPLCFMGRFMLRVPSCTQ